ncbi:histidine kinase dimerization/phosphoacceptor domain -containing protein [Trichocoleus sp. FACHB-262]|uniref:histidine kinase dimerization/phosphoacceptor domain -containing protein n=1 Tax=Trichocoleus sp. FACHB-262 TaxID=2692869 RepID=UPI001682F787|nr:histidine kinase dimerization/phosphoacceptor domain -containing protein [Trichocoleus sp. FACHB-262]MBD2121759.1 GAF domain-containing protein [Trichocoleus sp. FACHB-262]
MQAQDPLTSPLALETAIDRRPLTASPDTSVAEVIAMMSKAQSSCVLPSLELSRNIVLMGEARASAILVVEGSQLLGVFSEREAIQAITTNQNLAETRVDQVMQRPAIALTQTEHQDVFTALALLRQHQIQHLPVVDPQGQWVGLVTPASIRNVLQLDELLKSKPLVELAAAPAVQAPVTTTLLDLAQLMLAHRVDYVVLSAATPVHEMPTPVGIILERHIIQLWALGLDLAQIPTQKVMSAALPCFPASESVLVAYWEMQQQRVQRLGVSGEAGELLSVISPTSFLYSLDLDEMRSAVAQLQRSIEDFEVEKNQRAQSWHTDLETQLLENPAELLEQLQCSQILTAMALHIRESLNLNEILQTAVNEVRRFLQTDRVIIYRFNPDMSGTVVVESVAEGWRPALNSNIRDTCFGQNYAQAYKKGRTQVTEDIYRAGLTQCHIDILVLYDIRASLVVPILQGEHLWGLLCAYHCAGPRRWRQFEVELLKQLATHMAIAIQQSELYHQVQNELAERKRAEEQLKLSLKEKEVLLKEIHHRVKNNLQVISSVLRLQSDYVKDDKILALFNDSQNRIRSMALIHEKLYQSSNLLKINFDEYIHDLTENLIRSYVAFASTVTLTTNAIGVWLNIDTAIPCGLIINELVSNALKHAFLGSNPDNEIQISITSGNDNQFTLIVRDNGMGFPEDIDFRNTESLGLELVCVFTEQLDGAIALDRSNGTAFVITFSEIGNIGRTEKNGQ